MSNNRRVLGRFAGDIGTGAAMYALMLFVDGGPIKVTRFVGDWVGDDSFIFLMTIVHLVMMYGSGAFILWWVWVSIRRAIKDLRDE